MANYLRPVAPAATWFFTVALARRPGSSLLIKHIDALREATARTKTAHPFRIDAMVILPEHLHAIWTLPKDDTAIGMRWSLIKSHFSRRIGTCEPRSASRVARRERGIWQRRFWEHLIRDEKDQAAHIDYIHYNPVKHGWVQRAVDWPYSSFHRYVAQGYYSADWGYAECPPDLPEAGE